MLNEVRCQAQQAGTVNRLQLGPYFSVHKQILHISNDITKFEKTHFCLIQRLQTNNKWQVWETAIPYLKCVLLFKRMGYLDFR